MWQTKVEILLYTAKDSIVIAGDRASLASVVALCFIAIWLCYSAIVSHCGKKYSQGYNYAKIQLDITKYQNGKPNLLSNTILTKRK